MRFVRPAAPARRPRGRGAAPAQSLRLVASMPASVRSVLRRRPISTRSRARCDSSACLARNARASSASRGHVAGPGFGKRAGQREQHRARRQRNRLCRHGARRGGRHRRRAPSTPAAFRRRRAAAAAPRRAQSAAPRAYRGRGAALSTSASQRRDAAPRARRARPASSAARAALISQAPDRDPGDDQLVGGTRCGRQRRRIEHRRAGARPRRGGRSAADAASRDSARARHWHGRRALRASRAPCSSGFAGQPRSRETSAISASATTQRARATASRGPKARAARRSSALARTRSPSCAIAMPRSASAGASSRKATTFSAPSASPAASARAAAVISESIEIPSHLSLPRSTRSTKCLYKTDKRSTVPNGE